MCDDDGPCNGCIAQIATLAKSKTAPVCAIESGAKLSFTDRSKYCARPPLCGHSSQALIWGIIALTHRKIDCSFTASAAMAEFVDSGPSVHVALRCCTTVEYEASASRKP